MIIDDDKVAQKAIGFLVSRVPFLSLVGSAEHPVEALEILKTSPVDIIFLDIETPEINGLDFLKNFDIQPQVIVCSAKKEYAADVYEFNVTDYLVKPISFERFSKAVEKAREMQEEQRQAGPAADSFFIKNKGNYLRVNTRDILYFEALSDYVNIHTSSGKYTVYSTMHAIEGKLPEQEFVRIHRSYIARLDKITTIEENRVLMKEVALPVSKSYKRGLTSRLNFL